MQTAVFAVCGFSLRIHKPTDLKSGGSRYLFACQAGSSFESCGRGEVQKPSSIHTLLMEFHWV